MKVALVCALILCGLMCVLGIGFLFEVSHSLAFRFAVALVLIASGTAFGAIVAEEIKKHNDGQI